MLTIPRPFFRALLGAALCLVTRGGVPRPEPAPVPVESGTLLRVLHFGDSHTGSDSQQAVLKNGLQDRFGDGGSGYGLPWLQRRNSPRTGSTGGWRKIQLAGKASDALVGLSGGAMEASRRGERLWFEGSFCRLRLYLLRQPQGGTVRVSVDGLALAEPALSAGSPDVVVVERAFGHAPGPHRLQLETQNDGRCRVLGLALEGCNGASYSPLGVNGAQAAWLLKVPEPVLETQLRREAPNLIVLAFGTNEATGRDFDPASYQYSLGQVLDRLRRAAPQAHVLLVAPPDAALPTGKAGALDQITAVQRAQAGAQGTGFVDLRAAMGGSGSIQTWLASGLAQNDRVHFTAQGYGRHGQNVLTGMLRSLDGAPGLPAVQSGTPHPVTFSSPRLASHPAPAPAPKSRPIYVFRTDDGRTLITDTPSTVAGQAGQWVGPKPGAQP